MLLIERSRSSSSFLRTRPIHLAPQSEVRQPVNPSSSSSTDLTGPAGLTSLLLLAGYHGISYYSPQISCLSFSASSLSHLCLACFLFHLSFLVVLWHLFTVLYSLSLFLILLSRYLCLPFVSQTPGDPVSWLHG